MVSKYFQNRDLVVYTPPSYFENTLKPFTNVLIMHDGQNLFNESTSFDGSWMCQDTIDVMVYVGHMEEIIIVGVDNTDDRINEYTYSYDNTVKSGGKGNLYLDFLQQTVVPIIQKDFRVQITSSTNLGILGSSLGGIISCYAGWTRNSIFGKAGCMSSSFWWNNEDFNNVILNKFSPPLELMVYLDSGDSGEDDDDEQQTIRVRDHIENLGFELNQTLWYYLDHGGQHNEYYWGARFWVPMTSFYPPSLSPTHSIENL